MLASALRHTRGSLLPLGLIACGTFGVPPSGPSPSSAPTDEDTNATRTLRILAINDFHGALYEEADRADPSQRFGGLPWLAGTVDALRAEVPASILLDGGDSFQGSWPVNATHGEGSRLAFDLLDVNAAAVGNHEFDYGPGDGTGHPLRGALNAAFAAAPGRWLATNITQEDGSPWQPEGLLPRRIIEVGGVRVGLFGLSTEDTPTTTRTAFVADLRFTDVVPAAHQAATALRDEGAEVVVLLGHLTGSCSPTSYTEPAPCSPGGEIGRLLEGLPDGLVDVMVLGHAHTLMAERKGNTFLLENRHKGHLIGVLDLVVGAHGVDADASTLHPPVAVRHPPSEPGCDGGTWNLAPATVAGRAVTPRPEAAKLIQSLEARTGSLCDPVGCTTAPFVRSRTELTPIAKLFADAMLKATPDAEVALTNAGGIRDNLPAGTISRGDVFAVMPFDNRLVTVQLTGAQLQLALRIGSSGAHGMILPAGLRYHFDPARTEGTDIDGDGDVSAWERDRLCSVHIGDAPLDPARTYTVVTTDFLFGGGDHLGPAFAGVEIQHEGELLRDAIEAFIREHDGCMDPDASLNGTPRVIASPCTTP